MATANSLSSPAAAVSRSYRCVCGESFDVPPSASRSCPKCGRHYAAQAFAANLAETLTIHSGSDRVCAAKPVTETATDELLGQTLGHFRIIRLLGAGGMGSVYQALDESLQRYVALKVIRVEATAEASHYERLVQEARAQARVSHPHVVHIYFVGLNEAVPFFAMELLPGPTLADRLQDGPLPFADVARIGWQIAGALDRAAQFDIVHGDIKPNNILEVDAQTVKISDFGLSKRLSQNDFETGAIAGTPNYLSPETARGEPTDVRSDIYSLGITLFELTFGRLPYDFTGTTLMQKLEVHLRQAPRFPEPWPEAVPEAWRGILARMLAKNPAERYGNYAQLAADLRAIFPARIIPAARLPRCLAWLIDLTMFGLLQAGTLVPAGLMYWWASSNQYFGTATMVVLASLVLGSLALFLAMYNQCHLGRTPGKVLFQLRIVDRHGFSPSRRRLALRFLMQFPPLLSYLTLPCTILNLSIVSDILDGGLLLLFLVSSGMMLLSREGLALHDRLLKTRVVVDTQ